MAGMNTIPPDSFYLVSVDRPSVTDTIDQKWQAWQRFLQRIGDKGDQCEPSEKLTETLFLFHSKSGVLRLGRFLEVCKKAPIAAKVFFLPQKPEPCE